MLLKPILLRYSPSIKYSSSQKLLLLSSAAILLKQDLTQAIEFPISDFLHPNQIRDQKFCRQDLDLGRRREDRHLGPPLAGEANPRPQNLG